MLLFLTSTDVFSNNSEWCLSLWAKIFLEEQPLLDIFLLSLSPFQPSVFFPNFRKEHQVVTELSSHPESPLVATDFLHSSWEPHAADYPPPAPLPSPSYLRQSTGHSPLTPPRGSPPACFWQDEFDLWPFELTAQSAFYGTSHRRESIATHGSGGKKTWAGLFRVNLLIVTPQLLCSV